MDLKYGSDEAKKFITNVGLITSVGKNKENIMSAEWTHVISYSPWLVMINIGDYTATAENILETKEFGVSVASEAQDHICSIAGSGTGKELDKIGMLKEIGVEFVKSKKIAPPLVSGAALNLECKVIKHEKIGNKIMVIGEVVNSSVEPKTNPIIFSSGGYKKLSDFVGSKPRIDANRLEELTNKYRKN